MYKPLGNIFFKRFNKFSLSCFLSLVLVPVFSFAEDNWQRTVVLIYGQTERGQDMFFRGGIDSTWSNTNRETECTASVGGDHNIPCSIGIRHLNELHEYTRPWRTGDNYLDWGKLTPERNGREAEQTGTNSVGELAVGTPAVWTTNNCASGNAYSEHDLENSCHASPRLYGGGYTAFNQYGDHYWILDVLMNCDDTPNGWFEFKSYISNGPGWERHLNQTNFGGLTPPSYQSGNHFAACGKVNVFSRNSDNPVSINNNIDSDYDGTLDYLDTDDDNDGTPDVYDVYPLNPEEQFDTDYDGVGNNADVDDDNDGLIEIFNLADLDDIRNHLDGRALFNSNTGCPTEECSGFELMADLNFDTNNNSRLDANDEFWNEGLGWLPIGTNDVGNRFATVFDGNGYSISNLFINRPNSSHQGLFAFLDSASVRNLALMGAHAEVTGRSNIGSLAGTGYNSSVEQVMSSVSVTSTNVSAYTRIGGLIGSLSGESIINNSIYSGRVKSFGGAYAGGLVGVVNSAATLVSNSYSSASLATVNTTFVGGMIGGATAEAEVIESYWVLNYSPIISSSRGGSGVWLEQLQCRSESNLESDCSVAPLTGWSALLNESGDRIWDLGQVGEMPGLVMNGRVYRDTDSDGGISIYENETIGGDDAWPTNIAASRDLDNDGAADRWSVVCDAECRVNSGLVYDRFPQNPSFSIDDDLDGLPDILNAGCDEFSCENPDYLQPEPSAFLNDSDNDGITNDVDTDDNGDGILDVDSDSDGLIDVRTLGQLNAIRYGLDGRAYYSFSGDTSGDDSGCNTTVVEEGYELRACLGYELLNDLDFDTNQDGVMNSADAYWNNGEGWESLGDAVPGGYFTAILEGNGHVISNLYINKPTRGVQGLFAYLYDATVRNLVLLGQNSSITSVRFVGAVAGRAFNSSIEQVISAVPVHSTSSASTIYIGGLVGSFLGRASEIKNSVYAGRVSAEGGSFIGGISGHMQSYSTVTNTYSSAPIQVSNTTFNGGLFGSYTNVEIVESYWLTNPSSSNWGSGGVGVTPEQLQCRSEINTAEDCLDAPLTSWELETNDQGDFLWHFGDGATNQFPGLLLNGRIFREDNGEISISSPNSTPIATNPVIDSPFSPPYFPGDLLLAVYGYQDIENDPEGDSTFQWYRDGEAIGGATDHIYQIRNEDAGTSIHFTVTPVAQTGNQVGNSVISNTVTIEEI